MVYLILIAAVIALLYVNVSIFRKIKPYVYRRPGRVCAEWNSHTGKRKMIWFTVDHFIE